MVGVEEADGTELEWVVLVKAELVLSTDSEVLCSELEVTVDDSGEKEAAVASLDLGSLWQMLTSSGKQS